MSQAKKVVDRGEFDLGRARVLGRGLGALKGVRLPLRVVREAAGKTQTELSIATGIDQGDISRLEARETLDDCQLATLRRYVEALGGELQLVAAFGKKRITLTGV